MKPIPLSALIGFPGLPWSRHHGRVSHPLVSLVVLLLIVVLVAWAFRRKSN
jgi:hypothetical protein